MHGYRAERAFDGERVLTGGALVLVEDGTIVGVEPADATPPAGCDVTDLAGATLVPGLIDTHVHLCADGGPRALDQLAELDAGAVDQIVTTSLRRQLAAGVTALRDLGDADWAVVDRHRGPGPGPTVVAAGPPITSVRGHCWWLGGEATGVEQLRRAVRERAERGADVVKIMASGGVMSVATDVLGCQFTLDELRAVVDEAHAVGLPVTAHAHPLTAVERCAAAGVDGIEHGSCFVEHGFAVPAGLSARLARAGTPVCPTLGRTPGVEPAPQMLAVITRLGMTWDRRLAQVTELREAGIRLVSGTDGGINPSKTHGVLSEAVIDLVDCGASAEEALASATSAAARACGLAARTGRLAAGLDADLLAVDGDPLTDIRALRAVRTVVSRGRVVGPGGTVPD
ncbi:amidohydrolase family protein [Modestobacter marinus]|uniref:amidohydrolase family protein n=1 Tax=Modestobacter marinus TaxID=477641 RepID=UPI001C95B981|nr:amidohydrolase family protein [Modestobacter marinus]